MSSIGSRSKPNFGVNGARARIPEYLITNLGMETQEWIKAQYHQWSWWRGWEIPISTETEIPNEIILKKVEEGEGAVISLAPSVTNYWIANIADGKTVMIVKDDF
jgi:hypothetical protein